MHEKGDDFRIQKYVLKCKKYYYDRIKNRISGEDCF
jgi:hypothetical protein